MSHQTQFDIIIIGGGLVGASLAVALAESPYKIAVIEPFKYDSAAQPSYDERTIALTYSAKHIFSQIKVWDEELEHEACALKSIHISNKGHFGLTRLSHVDAGTEALGYVVPTRALGKALFKQMSAASNIEFFCPFEAKQLKQDPEFAEVTIKSTKQNSQGKSEQHLKARLVVIADGGRSPLLASLGFTHENKPYPQSALLSIVSTNTPHQHKAYERFLEDGPLALLPMTKQRFAVVWTLAPEELKRIAALNDAHYIDELQSTFGMRAGLLSDATPRKSYPLGKTILNTPYSDRVVVLGNAAHTVHPVAGQGFNLGLRDVASLAELLIDAENTEADIGNRGFLKTYVASREADTQRVGQFTDGLLRLFAHPSALVKLGRNLGLALVDNLPFVKRALLKRTMGMSKHQPRLARGLKIR